MEVLFNLEMLNKKDRQIYERMTESEKKSFERTWILIETNKKKLEQEKHRAVERDKRQQKDLSEKARKERTHRLIERGAIIEKFIPESISNDDAMKLLIKMFELEEVKNILSEFKEQGSSFTGIVEDEIHEEEDKTIVGDDFF